MYAISELKQMLFLDIETTTNGESLQDYNDILNAEDRGLEHWEKKAKYVKGDKSEYSDLTDADVFQKDAALYPEFGKVIVISIGQITFPDGITPVPKVKSFYGNDEKELLGNFMQTLTAIFSKNAKVQLVGHNIKGFDMPYIIKRSIINGVEVTPQLHLHKVKPWENCLLDTKDIWKFGGWSSASLSHICDLLGIPSPKQNMYGGEVAEAYWNGRLEEIKNYCEDDVIGTMNILLKMSSMQLAEKNMS
jgi:predicted PolB exonuclease-like 3'-5' exonuclease